MGPVLLLGMLLIEGVAYFIHLRKPLPLSLPIPIQIGGTVLFALIFFTGYLSFIVTYLKHSVGKKVIKSGPYRLVRHPLYAADLITIPAVIAIWFNDLNFVIAWIVACAFLSQAVKFEERFMEERFGEDYRAYKKKVPSIIPYKGFVKLD
jgi:protein-S-isoprenylcysteine O-methyltransferase Ste14